MESKIKSVRVKDIILDPSHDSWTKDDDIGVIYYKEIKTNGPNLPVGKISNLPTARPLFSFVKNYPIKEEIVQIITSQGNDALDSEQDYYLPPLNIHSHPHHNSFPFTGGPQFGEYFAEAPKLKPLLNYEGDIIVEGRFGNSIRFGATTDMNKNTTKNRWSNEGGVGNPITIIRNGQIGSQEGQEENPLNALVEDIDGDASSIYLCSNQQLSDFIPASSNFKSWGANLKNNETESLIFEPEITSQPLLEEEPVITQPVDVVFDEMDPSEKIFDDYSGITEYYTDTNETESFETNIILNPGTIRYKWKDNPERAEDPISEEIPEITKGLDQLIGANFTLKELIFSQAATNPEFGIHEEAEYERIGIYFKEPLSDPDISSTITGVQGYYVKDILGFYHNADGFNESITVKDSDMNELYKTTPDDFENSFWMGIFHYPLLLNLAEENVFSTESPYYDYNIPNPGINNYPGIDEGVHIEGLPGDEIVSNLTKVMENCIDKIIEKYKYVDIVSAYRSLEVNNSIDSSSNLDHIKGQAIDFRIKGYKTSEVFNWCFDNIEEWKDMVWAYPERGEKSWIHISYEEGKNDRHTTLASDIDSIHQWYQGDRRGDKDQYQDGICGANEDLVCGVLGSIYHDGAGPTKGGGVGGFSGCEPESSRPTRPHGTGILPNAFRDDHFIKMTSNYGYRIHPVTGKQQWHGGLDLSADTGTEMLAPLDGFMEWCEPTGVGNYNGGNNKWIDSCKKGDWRKDNFGKRYNRGRSGCGARLGVSNMTLSDGRLARIFTCHAWKPAMTPNNSYEGHPRELRDGDPVLKGQVIGYTGGGAKYPKDAREAKNVGGVTGPHFHLEVGIADTPGENGVYENKNPWYWVNCNSATSGESGCPEGSSNEPGLYLDEIYQKWDGEIQFKGCKLRSKMIEENYSGNPSLYNIDNDPYGGGDDVGGEGH